MVKTLETSGLRIVNPPVANGLPLIGSLPEILLKQIDFLEYGRATYGDIYKMNLPGFSMIILNRPEHMQHVFRDHVKNYPKEGAIWDTIRDLLGNGLTVSSGDFWLRQRRMMQPEFHRQRLSALTDVLINIIEDNFQKWERFSQQDKPFNISPEFAYLNMQVVLRTLFGTDISDADTYRMGKMLDFVPKYMMLRAVSKPLPRWIPVPKRTYYYNTLKQIITFIDEVIEKRRQNLSNDLISMLIEARDTESNEQMTNQQLCDEVISIYVAFETTSLTLSWMIYYLTQYPAIIERLQAEVDSVLGKRQPHFEDLQHLTYTRQVFQETLRLCPPVVFLPRMAVEDDVIDGFHIPAGQMVIAPIYTIHRHPEFWQTPEVFDPDRFSAEQSHGRHPMAWVPFGAGPRVCIGREFAYMEGVFALAMLIQRFVIKAPTNFSTKPRLLMTLHPQKGIMVHLKQL